MEKLGPVSQEEMNQKFPDLMEALFSGGETFYCNNCDGIRTHKTEDCPYPNPYAHLIKKDPE